MTGGRLNLLKDQLTVNINVDASHTWTHCTSSSPQLTVYFMSQGQKQQGDILWCRHMCVQGGCQETTRRLVGDAARSLSDRKHVHFVRFHRVSLCDAPICFLVRSLSRRTGCLMSFSFISSPYGPHDLRWLLVMQGDVLDVDEAWSIRQKFRLYLVKMWK